MSVSLAWTSSTAAQGSGGLALVTGDTLTQTSWQGLVSNVYLLSQLAQGPGQLVYVSSTQVKFKIVNGAVIRIAGTLYNLTADITANNTSTYIDGVSGNLASSTLYYVYAFISSGTTVSLTFSTTAYTIDTTTANVGTYIKSGQAGYTLVGLIRTNGSSQFADSATQRFVRSWFNDPGIAGVNNFTADRSTTSATFVELNSEIRIEFLAWSGEVVKVVSSGVKTQSSTGAPVSGIGFDGTSAENPREKTGGSTAINFSCAIEIFKTGLAEGYHYVTLLGHYDGVNTGTWQGTNDGLCYLQLSAHR